MLHQPRIDPYSCGNQLFNRPRQPTKQTSYPKYGVCKQKASLAAEYVAQFAVEWLEGRQSQEVAITTISCAMRLYRTVHPYAVAIHDILFRALRSLPIFPYAETISV